MKTDFEVTLSEIRYFDIKLFYFLFYFQTYVDFEVYCLRWNLFSCPLMEIARNPMIFHRMHRTYESWSLSIKFYRLDLNSFNLGRLLCLCWSSTVKRYDRKGTNRNWSKFQDFRWSLDHYSADVEKIRKEDNSMKSTIIQPTQIVLFESWFNAIRQKQETT